jgi:hypothetical protein
MPSWQPASRSNTGAVNPYQDAGHLLLDGDLKLLAVGARRLGDLPVKGLAKADHLQLLFQQLYLLLNFSTFLNIKFDITLEFRK